MTDDNVIKLVFTQELKPAPSDDMRVLTLQRGFCDHASATVHQRERVLQCNACSAHLDPFDFVFNLSHRMDVYVEKLRQLADEATKRAERVEQMKRDEANLRARIKRLEWKP